MKFIIVCIITLLLQPQSMVACSMYKVTKDGKTIVGNNEDWFSPNSQFWFETGENGQYSVMYMGLLDRFAQGAINDRGLMFDGFANPHLAVNNTDGKIETSIGAAVRSIMQTMENVEEVKGYLETLNLSVLSSSMLVFVDKSGRYLIVEGDELIIGQEAEQCFSNFYYSQIKDVSEVELPNVQNGLKHLESTEALASMDYCATAMDHLSSVNGSTQYTTVYDLKNLTVQVYLYHDFSDFVTIDLKKRFKKKDHDIMIAELFPKNTKGYENYQSYNNQENPSQYLEDLVGGDEFSEEELSEMGMNWMVNSIGNEWLNDKSDPKSAIDVFEYGVKIMPNDADLHDGLGEAYYRNEDYDKAIEQYNRSLELNSDNENAVEKLAEIRLHKSK